MMRRVGGLAAYSLLLLGAVPFVAIAQDAVTITGHVSAASMPIRGASVRIQELDLGATTDAEGRYSFIVPSVRVRGQTVTLTARYLRYRPQSVSIVLVGGSLLRDFELSADSGVVVPPPRGGDTGRPAPQAEPRAADRTSARALPGGAAPTPTSVAARRALPPVGTVLDSTVFEDVAGPVDVPAALAGRLAGVDVQTSSAVGGSSSVLVRGAHTLAGTAQPLYVVDGIIVDNHNVSTQLQRAGLGGFDYGSAIEDLDPQDVASVEVLRGTAAAMRYGGRGANGVVLITMKNARGLNGFDVAVSQKYTRESVLRLPEYQNAYGQGLGGLFAFFDGKGGGINDATDQSWGPPLTGQPVSQASLVEAARPDVRGFFALPNNVSSYFTPGRTLATNVGLQGGSDMGHVRALVSARDVNGLTTGNSISRKSVVLDGDLRASPALSLGADLQIFNDDAQQRPGSGFDESNPVSVFSHMPRQIDVAAYQTRLRDATNKQLTWNYAGHNNPYFAALANNNHDSRSRYMVGASATWAMSSTVSALARVGTDHSSDTRAFSVANGWMGGFPFYAGRGDFSTGGFETDDISSAQTSMDVALRAAPVSAGPTSFVFTAGAGRRADHLDLTVLGTDRQADSVGSLAITRVGSGATNYAFGGVDLLANDYASLGGTVRFESASFGDAGSSTTVYPAVMGRIDFARRDSSHRAGMFDRFELRAGVSRSGSDATGALLHQLGGVNGATATLAATLAAPEVTTGFEGGVSMRTARGRLGLDLSGYSEKTEELIVPSGASYLRGGSLTNTGVEATLSLVPVRKPDGSEWRVDVTLAHNTNQVDALPGGLASATITPGVGGVSVEARPGSSMGSIVGLRFRRDANGQLALRNGLPQADSAAGPVVLGESQPSLMAGISSGIRIGGFELSALVDARQGGKIFSASNRAGAVSGVLGETLARPDSGLLIVGTDLATNGQNTKHVSTEAYYHALAPIGERWVYDAGFVKLREVKLSYALPLAFLNTLHAQTIRTSLIARNVAMWTKAPNIDPEAVLSTSALRGVEMGQLPAVRSIGIQISLTP